MAKIKAGNEVSNGKRVAADLYRRLKATGVSGQQLSRNAGRSPSFFSTVAGNLRNGKPVRKKTVMLLRNAIRKLNDKKEQRQIKKQVQLELPATTQPAPIAPSEFFASIDKKVDDHVSLLKFERDQLLTKVQEIDSAIRTIESLLGGKR